MTNKRSALASRLHRLGMLVALAGVGSLLAGAELPAAEPARGLIEPVKVTVGPWDNFDGRIDPGSGMLIHTQSRQLASHLRRFDPATGREEALLPPDADSRAGRPSPDGRYLAWVSHRDHALGAVCVSPLPKLEPDCPSRRNAAAHDPVWLDTETLAWVETSADGRRSLHRLRIGGAAETAHPLGNLHAPTAAPEANRLLLQDGQGGFVLLTADTLEEQYRFELALPGRPGPAALSADGRHLWLTLYMLDANQDLRIDARDRAAIFRIDLDTGTSRPIPRQLTSTDRNCAYPQPVGRELYVTCAFEGSLDIYRLPASGSVPADWNADALREAHRSARSHADRLLLLNRLHELAPDEFGHPQLRRRSLNNLVLMEEWLAAADMAAWIEAQTGSAAADVAALRMLGRALAGAAVLPGGRPTAAWRQQIAAWRKEAASLPKADGSRDLVEAWLAALLAEPDKARQRLATGTPQAPILRLLHSRLWLRLHPDPDRQQAHLERRLQEPDLGDETRFHWLAALLDLAARQPNAEARLNALAEAWPDEPMASLIQHELDLGRILASRDPAEQRVLLRQVTRRARDLRDDYYALRLLMSRGMIRYSRDGEAVRMSDLAGLWISYVERASLEYPHVVEIFRRNTLDTAYRFLHRGESSYAEGAFFDNLRMSDDLEGHYRYARAITDDTRWQQVLQQYGLMIQDGLIRETSRDFAMLVHDLHGSAIGAAPNEKQIRMALTRLEGLPADQPGIAVAHLLRGWLWQQHYQQAHDGLRGPREALDAAHREYLLALDQGWNNERLRATALQNLGLLHGQAGNAALASEYLRQRAGLGFENAARERAFRWWQARILYRAHRSTEALAAVERGLELAPEDRLPWIERAGFYAMTAGQAVTAATYYRQTRALWPEADLPAGLSLAWGASLLAAGDAAAALPLLTAVREAPSRGAPAGLRQGIRHHPDKNLYVALGLLARVDEAPAEARAGWLAERIDLGTRFLERPADYYFEANTLRQWLLLDRQRRIGALLEAGQAAAAAEQRHEALARALAFGPELGFLSRSIQQTLRNAIAYSLSRPTAADRLPDALLAELDQAATNELDNLALPSANLLRSWGETRLLLEARIARRDLAEGTGSSFSARSAAVLEAVAERAGDMPGAAELLAGLERSRIALSRLE